MIKSLYNLKQWDDVTEYLRVGEILMMSDKINLLNLSMALDVQKVKNLPLGELFVMMKVINYEELQQALVVQDYIERRVSCSN